MPERKTIQEARRAKREGKAPSTQAGPFVHEEIEHVRQGKHGARSTKQAIAIGLSKARRSGVDLPPPRRGQATEETRRAAARDRRQGKASHHAPSRSRSESARQALSHEGRRAASHEALSRQAKSAARRRREAR